MMSVADSVCRDAAGWTTLSALVYSCKAGDDTDVVLNCQVCKETLCPLSLSVSRGWSFGCCFLLCSIKEFAVDISHCAAPDERTEV